MASGRARAVGELAVVRRRADRAWRRTARRSSPSCRAAASPPAFASYAEWEAWVERLVADRRDGGLHAHLVGRARRIRSSGRSRCACPTSRPTCGSRPRSPRSSRRCARRRSRTALPRRTRGACRLRPEPVGGSALRPAREPDPSRRLVVPDRDRARASSCSSACGRRRERLGGGGAPRRASTRRAVRRTRQLDARDGARGRRGARPPIASLKAWQSSRRRSRSAASAARSA